MNNRHLDDLSLGPAPQPRGYSARKTVDLALAEPRPRARVAALALLAATVAVWLYILFGQ